MWGGGEDTYMYTGRRTLSFHLGKHCHACTVHTCMSMSNTHTLPWDWTSCTAFLLQRGEQEIVINRCMSIICIEPSKVCFPAPCKWFCSSPPIRLSMCVCVCVCNTLGNAGWRSHFRCQPLGSVASIHCGRGTSLPYGTALWGHSCCYLWTQ